MQTKLSLQSHRDRTTHNNEPSTPYCVNPTQETLRDTAISLSQVHKTQAGWEAHKQTPMNPPVDMYCAKRQNKLGSSNPQLLKLAFVSN